MQYFISFLEGIITFVSPCLLPMLPIYVSYFAGGEENIKKTVKNALGFILGFTLVFVAMGAFAGSLGRLLKEYSVMVNLIAGAVVVFFGLNFLGILKLNIFKGINRGRAKALGFFSSVLFGFVFSLGWTPCVGAFLGSALLLAASGGEVLKGIVMLFAYSLGLGIPFFLSAVLIDKLKGAFNFIKANYRVINIICGSFLIVVGLLMASGFLGRFLTLIGG